MDSTGMIFLFLSISAVSAEDNSLTDLQVMVDNSNDTINLEQDYSFVETDLKDGVLILKDMKINGNNHTINAQDSAGIFKISNASVYFENINFINANCDNVGAILAKDSNIVIKNCTFINNKALFGGAISIHNSDGSIENSLFLNNSGYGSAIYFDYTYEHNFRISNSIFNNNIAQESFGIDGEPDSEYRDGIAYLYSSDNLADHQIDLSVPYEVSFLNLTFTNVSYNEFKNQSFKVKDEDLNENMDNETIRFEVYKDNTCNELLINTTNITHNGKAKVDYENLSNGYYYLRVYYKNLTDSATIRVRKDVNFTISVEDIFIGEDIVIKFNISPDIEEYNDTLGNVEIWEYDNDTFSKTYPVYDSGFNFKDNNITIPGDSTDFNYALKSGHYIVLLDFYGDTQYPPKRINQTFNVYPPDYNMTGNKTIIKVEDFEKTFLEDKRLYINLTDINNTPLKNKEISIKINGVTYTRTTDDNGQASIAINLASGKYSVIISFKGDNQYLPSTEIVFIEILSTIDCDDFMKKYCRDSNAFWARFFDYEGNNLKEGNATFNINGVFYTRNINEDGYARLNINLAQGVYIITATNPVTGDMKSCLITVLPTITDNFDLVKYYKNESQYIIRLQGEDFTGQKVVFNINGVFYERISDENGIVKLNINLQPGEYIITAEFNGCRVSNNITVLPVLNASDLKMSYLDGSKFEAKLIDGKGNPKPNTNVTFNINGVFYHKATEDNGIAKLNINLQKGEYIITSSYNESNIANKITIV